MFKGVLVFFFFNLLLYFFFKLFLFSKKIRKKIIETKQSISSFELMKSSSFSF